MKPLISLFAIPLISMFVASCVYQPVLTTPQLQTPDLLISHAEQNFVAKPISQWWVLYGSESLNQLMDELNDHNLDLANARFRVQKAHALLGQRRAANWPTLDVKFSHKANHNIGSKGRSSETTNGNGLNFTAAYEVDSWASRSAAQYSAEVAVIAQQQEYHSQRLQLQAALAQAYFEFISLRQRYRIGQQNLQASQKLLSLIQLRFEAGSASGIELNQQRNTLLSTRAQLLNLQRALSTSERVVAVLLGREHLSVKALDADFSALLIPAISLVQSAMLLETRPDIQLAESQLRINEAALYQTKQKRWPSLKLSAGLGLDDVLAASGGWAGSLVSSVAMPLFNAGNIRRQIDAAESDVCLARIGYRQVVLQAMQETLDTLSELAYQQQLQAVRAQELHNNEALYELATLRYDAGDTGFINLLTAQRSWFNARDAVLQVKNAQLLATVNVFKAMGIAPELVTNPPLTPRRNP